MALGAGQAVLVQSVQIRVRIKLFHSVHALGGPLAGQQHQRAAHGRHTGGVADGLRADLLVALLMVADGVEPSRNFATSCNGVNSPEDAPKK